jgi:hypothetical protein
LAPVSKGKTRDQVAERIKELQPAASNRVIAKVVGVDETTIRRDTAANAASGGGKASKVKGDKVTPAANAATLSGTAAAKAVAARENKEANKAAKQEARAEPLRRRHL